MFRQSIYFGVFILLETIFMKSKQMDGAQALLRTLDDLGIEYIFGYSGGAALPMFDALETVESNMKFVLVRHEQGAVHMADGYARATGKPAAVLVTSGPGGAMLAAAALAAAAAAVPSTEAAPAAAAAAAAPTAACTWATWTTA